MPNISRLFTDVNLKYYHYDLLLRTFILDQKFTLESSKELNSITNLLTQHKQSYSIDTRNNIHIVQESASHKTPNVYILSDAEHKNAAKSPVVTNRVISCEVNLNQYDALIFSSKNAVLSMDSFNKDWRSKPAYTMIEQTANTIKKLGGELHFVNKSHFEVLKGKKILYVRAKETVSQCSSVLNEQDILCDELVVYETISKHQISRKVLPQNSIIIFSSPATVDCFFLNKEWDRSYRAITIGKATAQHLPESISPLIADVTSVESCIREALEV